MMLLSRNLPLRFWLREISSFAAAPGWQPRLRSVRNWLRRPNWWPASTVLTRRRGPSRSSPNGSKDSLPRPKDECGRRNEQRQWIGVVSERRALRLLSDTFLGRRVGGDEQQRRKAVVIPRSLPAVTVAVIRSAFGGIRPSRFGAAVVLHKEAVRDAIPEVVGRQNVSRGQAARS